MSKPSWDQSPKWARWLAQDSDSSWFWFDKKPKERDEVWINNSKFECASEIDDDWQQTLEKRPTDRGGKDE